jgi:hypothetical protein
MKLEVPIRKVEVFTSEDGRKIETHTYVQTVDREVDTQEKIEFYPKDKVVYFGISPNPNGPQVKFQIQDATSLNDAFEKYIPLWEQIAVELNKQIQAQQSKIITANDMDLKKMDQALGHKEDLVNGLGNL